MGNSIRKLGFLLIVMAFVMLSSSFVFAETDSSDSEKPTQIEIQKALAEAGFYKGTVDGIIGAKTRAAIRSFQEEQGLVVDGKVGPKTWEKLKAYSEKTETPETNEETLLQPAVEETPDYSMTLEPEPEPLPAEEDLKQKLVS